MTREQLENELLKLDKEEETLRTLAYLRNHIEENKAKYDALTGMTYYDGMLGVLGVALDGDRIQDLS